MLNFIMGQNMNLDFLSENECEHILAVLKQDIRLRDVERRRLSCLEAELAEEKLKRSLLSKYHDFNQKTCIRCLSRFFIFFNSRRVCSGCNFNVCRKCLIYDREDAKYVCKTCLKNRDLRRQSNEWFYYLLSQKFKRCGGEKVMRCLMNNRRAAGEVEAGVSVSSPDATQVVSITVEEQDQICLAMGGGCEDLLRLVEHVSRTQGQVSTTANRMLQSATDISSIYEELDKMDAALNDLELDIADVADDTLSSEDYFQQTSAEAVGDVTSAALELLGSFSNVISGRGNPCRDTQPVVKSPPIVNAANEEFEVTRKHKNVASADLFKHLEEQIYLSSGEVFSLEEHIEKLTARLLATDELTTSDTMADLENQVALAVAKVTHSDMEVNQIEQQLHRWAN